MFHMIGFIIFGLVVGLLARLIMPGRDSMSLPVTALLGVAGALIAGWLGRALGWYGPDDSSGFVTSTIGALILLFAYNAFARKRASKTSIRSDRDDRNYPRKVA